IHKHDTPSRGGEQLNPTVKIVKYLVAPINTAKHEHKIVLELGAPAGPTKKARHSELADLSENRCESSYECSKCSAITTRGQRSRARCNSNYTTHHHRDHFALVVVKRGRVGVSAWSGRYGAHIHEAAVRDVREMTRRAGDATV